MILSYHKSLHISFLYLDDIISYNITQTVMILNKMNKWQWYVVGLVKVGDHLDQQKL